MTESNHTPGPWRENDTDMRDEAQAVFSDHTGEIVADAILQRRPGECESNARLIAAAPDMLEALENIENDDGHMPPSEWGLIQDAIAKATGTDTSETEESPEPEKVKIHLEGSSCIEGTQDDTIKSLVERAVHYNTPLKGADLSGADLSGADLRRADLSGANLRRDNLSGADLVWANLRWADLRGANLRGADLRWANLRWADLGEADLRGAKLRGTDLTCSEINGVDLTNADLSGATLPDGTKLGG